MNTDRTIRTDRRASLSLEGQWHGPGIVANTSKPFRRDSEWPEPTRLQRLLDVVSPDFIGALITIGIVVGICAYAAWVAL